MIIVRYIPATIYMYLFLALEYPLNLAASLGRFHDQIEASNQGGSHAEIELTGQQKTSEKNSSISSDYKTLGATHERENIQQRENATKTQYDILNLAGLAVMTSEEFGGSRISRQHEISKIVNFTEIHEREQRQATVPERMFWPDAVVPWKYDMGRRRFRDPKSHPEIEQAMKFWTDNTCIKFIPYDDAKHLDFLNIGLGPGCSSVVGYARRGGQYLSLSERGCVVFGTITHEIGHSLGLFHEQCREDRNDYVNIIWDNVRSRYTFNFDVQPVKILGYYDLTSIMHYGPTAFSRNRKPTVEAKDNRLQFLMGQRDEPSFYDVMAINTMYHCAKRNCPNLITCHHGGYQDHTCSCKCPDGLAGENCERVDPNQSVLCGGVVELNHTIQEATITPPSNRSSDNPYKCVWIVRSPWFTKINANLEIPENLGFGRVSVCRQWLEVRYQLIGQKGVKSCLDSPLIDHYHSLTNLMLVKLDTSAGFSRDFSGFKLTVRISTKGICSTNPCDNNGICSPDADRLFVCTCLEGYSGKTCEVIEGPVFCEFNERDQYSYADSKKICFLEQSNNDDFDWSITDRATPSAGTGPMGGYDSYLFTEATDKLEGHAAKLVLKEISGGYKCLSVYVHMYGSQMGTFYINLLYDNKKLDNHFTISGNQGGRWKMLKINLLSPYTFTLEIAGIVGSGYKSDLALDKLSIKPGKCDEASYTLKIADFAGPEAFFCDFRLGPCGFVQANTNGARFEWKSQNGSTTKSRRTGPQQIRGSTYYYSEASEPAVYGDTARFVSPTFYNHGPYCLTFWYYAYGSGLGALSVLIEDYELEWNLVIWSTAGKITKDYGWNNVTLEINKVTEIFRIVFQSKRGDNYRGDYAIQDVSVVPQACPPSEKVERFPFVCDFNDGDLCGMFNIESTNTTEPWVLSLPEQKRPDAHGDTGSALDVLLWVYPIGQFSAVVLTPTFMVTGSACLEFWYHKTGFNSTSNYLVVYATEIKGGSTEIATSWPIWLEKEFYLDWTYVQVNLAHNGKLRLEFEAVAGLWWTSVNIDDLKFTPGVCR